MCKRLLDSISFGLLVVFFAWIGLFIFGLLGGNVMCFLHTGQFSALDANTITITCKIATAGAVTLGVCAVIFRFLED